MTSEVFVNRRDFIQLTALGTGAAAVGAAGCARADVSAEQGRGAGSGAPPSIQALKPMTAGIVPIADDERRARIAKAQRLMAEQKIDAVFMEGTASCFYFANMRWGQSERTFGLVIPAKGELAYVCPKFEEDRARELIKFGNDVRTWEEHESPYKLIVQIVRDRGLQNRRVGMEERVRFFIADGVRKEATGMEIVDATPVTAGCRIYKSPAEIALMQRANDVTIAAYRAALATMTEGMTQGQLSGNIAAAFTALGFSGGASVQVGKWSALPHGSITPQSIHQGDVVMIDGGTSCEGYASDITRTTVLGKPTPRQIDVWNKEKEAQTAAFQAMKLGASCESVDAAARQVIEAAGFGPGYKTPGLPHRTGHGIGLEGHEWTNFVKGNTTLLAPGMCFSDEPMIAIPGEFGIRLEDCVYFDQNGAHFFTKQSIAIDQPFG
jgi:Xaa-Pro dipeptidase